MASDMSYTAPTWVNGNPPSINATRLNNLCTTVQSLDETMPTKQDKLTFDDTPRANSSNPVKSSGIYTALQGKQSSLTFDSTPTQGSSNPVTSDGIYTAIQQGGGTITMDDVPTAGSSNPVKSSGIYNALQGKQATLTFDSTPTQGSTNPVTSNGIYYHYVGAGRLANTTVGTNSTAEGTGTTASGSNSHAEGYNTTASGDFGSHAEGWNTVSDGRSGHAEGEETYTDGAFGPHAEGYRTQATGDAGHAEGNGTIASGHNSHSEGLYTVAEGYCQHVFGKYNVADETNVEIVGWGTSNETRANIRTLDTSGNMTITGRLNQSSDSRLKTVEGEIPDVSGIHAVQFRWSDGRDDIYHVGYIAQDVEKVAPFMVKDDSNGYKALDYIALLCAKVDWLEKRVKELEER